MRASMRSPLLLVCLSLVLAGCTNDDDDTRESTNNTSTGPTPTPTPGNGTTNATNQTWNVNITNFTYSPQILAIAAGDTVRWTNLDNRTHTATANLTGETFDSGNLTLDQTFTWTFDEPGTVAYYCRIHPQMLATIRVT